MIRVWGREERVDRVKNQDEKKKKESDGVGATYQGQKEKRIRRDVDQFNVLVTDSELLMVLLFHWGKKKQDDLLRECRKELYATIVLKITIFTFLLVLVHLVFWTVKALVILYDY